MRSAHFTLSELPGTLSIWVAGVALGAALLRHDLRALAAPLALIAGIALASMLADRHGWAPAVEAMLDLAFLVVALACAWRLVHPPARLPA